MLLIDIRHLAFEFHLYFKVVLTALKTHKNNTEKGYLSISNRYLCQYDHKLCTKVTFSYMISEVVKSENDNDDDNEDENNKNKNNCEKIYNNNIYKH